MSRLREFEERTLPHMAAAHNLAFWIVRSRSDAEDIVQDAYLKAFNGFDGLRGEDARPWLLTIVRNTAYRWLAGRRRAGNVISLEDAYLSRSGDDRMLEEHAALQVASDEPNVEAQLVKADEQALMQRALALVAPVFREVLVLREIEEMSYRDIAEVIGSPIGTVMSRLSRARAELKLRYEALVERQDRNAV